MEGKEKETMASNVIAKCKHCHKELPPDHKGQCPYCGKVGKSIIATVTDYVSITASFGAQKVKRYTQKHPAFTAISIVLAMIALIVGYLIGGLVGLLVGIIVAILNWWLTPHAIETVVEITHLGDKGKAIQEAEVKDDTQQKGCSHKDICSKLDGIEKKIESGTRIQKFGVVYALGAAFTILGFSQWPGLMDELGIDTARYYVNSIFFIVIGFYTMIAAFFISR
jgi:RNA polymerase subunit RPABC4/transcription elongation factor Spt4